ncbi:hypothetical protein L6R29_21460 [Myxococcota bacterium]|nr:hypothetical protein [Myxococcota bacterium]
MRIGQCGCFLVDVSLLSFVILAVLFRYCCFDLTWRQLSIERLAHAAHPVHRQR